MSFGKHSIRRARLALLLTPECDILTSLKPEVWKPAALLTLSSQRAAHMVGAEASPAGLTTPVPTLKYSYNVMNWFTQITAVEFLLARKIER